MAEKEREPVQLWSNQLPTISQRTTTDFFPSTNSRTGSRPWNTGPYEILAVRTNRTDDIHELCNNSGTAKVKIVKNEMDPPLFTGKLLIKFQNILRNTTQVIIRHRVNILFSIISSPITLERQKWKSSKLKGILLSSPVNSW